MLALKVARKYVIVTIVVLIPLTLSGSFARAQTEEIPKDCSALSAPGTYPDYARLPSYSIVRRDRDGPTRSVVVLRISMPSEAFNGGAVLRLGCKLISDYQREKVVEALIFDDVDAARNLAPGFSDQAHYGTYLWHLRGRFELNRETSSAFVEFLTPEFREGLPSYRRIRYQLSDEQNVNRRLPQPSDHSN
jgi:hypothetical protein